MKEVSSSRRHGFFGRAHCNLNLGLTFGAVVAALFFGPLPSRAVPYASAVINNAGTVSFILNEAADNVTVVFDGGASMQDLGALGQGAHSFNLGGASSFEIRVSKSGVTPWTLISSDSNPLLQFNGPRGVAVNLNPATPGFGRIYVANSVAGSTTSGRALGDGLYVMAADQSDVLSRGNTASTAGLAFDTTGTAAVPGANSPWRIEVGEDGNLYVADFSTNTACIYYTDPDVTSSGQVLAGVGWSRPASMNSVHTTIGGSPIVRGSLAGGDLTVWANDGRYNFPSGGSLNRLMRWDVGSGPLPYANPPSLLGNPLINSVVDVTTDCDRAPDGKFFLMQNRANGTESGLFVMDTDGTTLLWSSLATTRSISNNPAATDLLRISRAVKVSPDNTLVALIRDDMQTYIVPLTNGVPDLSAAQLITTYTGAPTTLGRDVTWDAAGNLYALSSGNQLLRIFSRGGTTRAITRSDGTFTLVRPTPVSVVATAPAGLEDGPVAAVFTISRSGETTAPLPVSYTLTGTAQNGTDYGTNELSVVIPIGASSVDVTITPVDDAVAELTESVILTLVSSPDYDLAPPAAATAHIADNEYPNILTIVPVKASIYEPYPSDTASFRITRYGIRKNVEVFLSLGASGSATLGVDYSVVAEPMAISAGEVTKTLTISPVDDLAFEADEVVTVALVDDNNPDFDPGVPAAASITIREDDYPTACVLFSEGFDTAETSNSWTLRFGANNGVEDYTSIFGFEYEANGLPKPPNGSTHGLLLNVNKNDPTALGSAGINLYPIGQSFSGDYALRFDMYLQFGTPATGTEHALAGLNHSGNLTNRVTQSTAGIETTRGGDGIFVAIETDGSANREYGAYSFSGPNSLPLLLTNRSAAAMAPFVTSPPFSVVGSPGNGSTAGSVKSWAKVELAQLNNNITLRVNNAVVYTLTNTYGFTSGNILIGHNDQFDSVGSSGVVGNLVLIDNVQVVQLGLRIKRIELLPGNQVAIDFVSPEGGLTGDFHLQSASSLNEPIGWADDNTAIITATSDGFRATTARSGEMTYYQIRR